jgi:hypothetical protein
MAEVKCSKCGAQISYGAGDRFARCSYCDTQIYIDRSGAGFYYIMPYFIDEAGAQGVFRRWAAGSAAAKDLDRLARVVSIKKQYFPVYLFKRDAQGKDKVSVEPARSTTLPGLHSLKVPAGDIRIFDQSYKADAELLQPDIDMTAYLPKLEGTAKEQALLYFPLWLLSYQFDGKQYDLVIDGSSGETFVADFPARKAAPYLMLAAAAFAVFLMEGLFGLLLSTFLSVIAWIIMVPLAILTAPFVFVGAYMIVRRY